MPKGTTNGGGKKERTQLSKQLPKKAFKGGKRGRANAKAKELHDSAFAPCESSGGGARKNVLF